MTRIIDVHSHWYPPAYLDRLRTRSTIPKVVERDGDELFVIFPEEEAAGTGRPMDDTYRTVEAKLAFMDAAGIDQTVLSVGNPWMDPFTGDADGQFARTVNGAQAELAATTGNRIVGMGVLPSHDVDDAAAVVREIATDPGLVGIITGPHVCGLTFDAPALEPVWQALSETRVPVLLHPCDGVALDALEGFGHAFPVGLGFPFETTIAVARLVFSGVLRRNPDIRLIASHGGGTVPYLAGRFDAAWRSDPGLQDTLPTPPSTDLARLWLDAVVYEPRSLHAAADLVGADHIAFGTDHPFSVADPGANLAAIATTDTDDQRRILQTTATQLFGLPDPD